MTFEHILVATTDSVVLDSQLDDVDLYRPIVGDVRVGNQNALTRAVLTPGAL